MNAETKGNAGEMFGKVLQEMAVSGMLSISYNKLVGNSVPMRFSRNQQLLLNCIELAALAADKKDLELLASCKNSGDKKLINPFPLHTAFIPPWAVFSYLSFYQCNFDDSKHAIPFSMLLRKVLPSIIVIGYL